MILCYILLGGIKEMYNLLVKDFHLIKKHLWISVFHSFMIFILLQSIRNAEIIYSMGIVMIGYTMTIYTTAYDDKNESEVIINSLPTSRVQIVFTRYISVFLFAILGMVSMVFAGFILSSFNIMNINSGIKFESIIGGVVGLSIIAFLYLPTYFKYGYIKAKLFNLILFAVAFGGPMLFKRLLSNQEKPLWIDKLIIYLNSQSEFVINLIFIGAIIVMGLISFTISMAIYKKREF